MSPHIMHKVDDIFLIQFFLLFLCIIYIYKEKLIYFTCIFMNITSSSYKYKLLNNDSFLYLELFNYIIYQRKCGHDTIILFYF